MNRKILVASLLIAASILAITIPIVPMASAETSSSASIQAANLAIDRAYTNVVSAEKSGANIAVLLKNLNNAVELLAQADNATQNGDLNVTSADATAAASIANGVNTAALALQNSSLTQSNNDKLLTIVFSASSAAIYVVILFVIWRQIKGRYNKKLLLMKPEVVKNGA